MLGVMTVRQDELRVREVRRYRSMYCGLCHAIGARCSQTGRLALSYETTFMALVLCSLYEPETRERLRRCALHPLTRHPALSCPEIDYCADVSVLLAYFDLRDGWEDEHRVDRLAASSLLKRAALRAGERLPRQNEAVRRYVERLHEVETANDPNLDAAANLSGELMAELMVMKQDVYERDLRELGFWLGKFIYMCDAFEDLERDERKKQYNPLLFRKDQPDLEERVREMLESDMAGAAAAFERLPLLQDAEIMRNILYSGIFLRYEAAVKRRKDQKKP